MKYIIYLFLLTAFFIRPAVAEIPACALNMSPKTVQGQYDLAQAYDTGQCLAWNKEQAIIHYTNAAEHGHVDAQFKLAELYFTGYLPKFGADASMRVAPDYPAAKIWYEKAAEQGHGDAQLRLAFLYAEKHFPGVTNDLDAAEKWFTKAAIQNAGDARFRLGNFYQHYRKPPQYDKAFHWLQRAAEDGHRVAQHDLANFYLSGKGDIQKDTTKWYEWMLKSAKQDNLHAQIALSKAYQNGENGLEENAQKSILWAIFVAKRTKSPLWYNRIADAFYSGEGNLPQNIKQAQKWYSFATEKGDEHAAHRLLKIQSQSERAVSD